MKLLLSALLLLVSLQTSAQSSLDSLRLVLPEDLPLTLYGVTIDTLNKLIIEHRDGGDYFYDLRSLKLISCYYNSRSIVEPSINYKELLKGYSFQDKNQLFTFKKGVWCHFED